MIPRQFHCYGVLVFAVTALSVACGGGSPPYNNLTPSKNPIAAQANNVQPIIVNSGPAGNYANGVFTSVTLCVPSSSTCQTIDGILVDTGSYGLRILSSAGGGALTLSLPKQKGGDGNPVGECALFVSGYTWGSVNTADVSMAGEQASNVPVQVIDPTFGSVPSSCKNTGVPENDTLQSLGANGILGVGPFAEDCGGACTQSGPSNPGLYYSCASSCQITAQPLSLQVQNPVALFASDNNGLIVQLPALTGSATSLSGSMVFGIGTQSNNGLGKAQIFAVNSSGEFNTTFKGQSYPAFIDSGSNAYFFLDSSITGLATCSSSTGFYCPSGTQNLSAVTSSGTPRQTVQFSIANAESLFSSRGDFVFETLGGPNPGTFDWGLPFFFGRNVYTAIEARTTPGGTGPFWAY